MEPLGFWVKDLEHARVPLEINEHKTRQENIPKEEYHAKREQFSDADIDIMLKKLGLKPEESLRQIARFLISHRFNLSLELVDKVRQLLPEGPFQGQKAEALVAALSKLPLSQVQRGFEILLSTLNGEHPTVMGALKHFVSQLNDVLSETRLYQGQTLKFDLIQAAFKEELEQWLSWSSKPEQQVLALLDRQSLFQDLRRFIHLAQWAAKILEQLEHKHSEGLRRRLGLVQTAAKHTAQVMLADGILSKPDEFRHMRDHGLCYSLGIDWQDELLPCRMWAFDDMHGENLTVDEKNIHLFFRVVSQNLGLIEIEMIIDSNNLTLKFASDNETVRDLMNREADKLKEHLIKLGYEVNLSPSSPFLRQANPKVEIESKPGTEIVHMDVKA